MLLTPAVEPFLGVLMLDTRFPRPLGDIGHPESFGLPTRQVVIKGAWPDKVVASASSLRKNRLVEPFCQMTQHLVRQGAVAITTSCGFLVLLQADLQRAAGRVPVVTSSLLLLPKLLREKPQVGVLTISAGNLGKEHLRAAGVTTERLADVIVQGVPVQTEFASKILSNHASLDVAQAEADVVASAQALKARSPQLADVVLECTNMPPYAQAIETATGLRTWSLLQSSVLRTPFHRSSAPI